MCILIQSASNDYRIICLSHMFKIKILLELLIWKELILFLGYRALIVRRMSFFQKMSCYGHLNHGERGEP